MMPPLYFGCREKTSLLSKVLPDPAGEVRGPRCQGPSCVLQNARELYQKDIVDRWFLVFYFLLYVYYYNSRKKNNRRGKAGGQKGGTFMKIVKKIEALLNAYYETFKH